MVKAEKRFLDKLSEEQSGKYKTLKDAIETELRSINVNHPSLTGHGISHSKRLIENLGEILDEEKLERLLENNIINSKSLYILLVSIWLHDIGYAHVNAKNLTTKEVHAKHHEYSSEAIKKDSTLDFLGSDSLRRIIAEVSKGHRRNEDLGESRYDCVYSDHTEINKRFLSALLRIVDALDISEKRAEEKGGEWVKNTISHDARLHWDVCEAITGWQVRNSSIIISAQPESLEKRSLMEWKVDDLWNELVSCSDVLKEEGGIELNRIICKLDADPWKGVKIERPKKVIYTSPPIQMNLCEIDIDRNGKISVQMSEKYFNSDYFDAAKKVATDGEIFEEFASKRFNLFFPNALFERLESATVEEGEHKVKYKMIGKLEPLQSKEEEKVWVIPLVGYFFLEEFQPKLKLDEKAHKIFSRVPFRIGRSLGDIEIKLPDSTIDAKMDEVIKPPLPPHIALRYKTRHFK